MRSIRWRSISFQIILAVLLPLTAGAIFIAFYSQNLHHSAMQSMVGERNLRTVESLAALVDEIIKNRVETLTALSRHTFDATYLSKPQEDTAVFLQGFSNGVLLVDSNGKIIDQTEDFKLTEIDIQYILEQFANAEPPYPTIIVLQDPQSDAIPDYLAIIGQQISADTFLIGVVNLQAELTGVVNTLIKPGILSVQVFDDTHTLIFEAGRLPLDIHTFYHPGVLNGLEGQSGVLYPDTGHGQGQGAHVIAYAPIKRSRWVLVLDEAWEDVSSTELAVTQSAPLVLIPFFLLAVFALLIIIRQVVIPLQKLEKQTQALGEGDFSAVTKQVGGIAEVRSLQARMAEMAVNLRNARQSLQSYIGSITRGVEEERLRLSRDLHDDTLQSLIALKYRMQSSKEDDHIENPKVVQKVIDDLRRLVRDLRPVILEDLGLSAALESLIRQMEQETGIQTNYAISGLEIRYPAEVELAFFRIAQEALINVRKHSMASRVDLDLAYNPGSLTMKIMDNGKGYQVPEKFDLIVAEGHFGLIGMVERASLIHADIEFKSQPGEGTSIILRYSNGANSVMDNKPANK
jgi:signal transduction histidine kinase